MPDYHIIKNTIQIWMLLLTVLFLALAAIIIQYLQVHKNLEQLPYLNELISILLFLYPIFWVERLIFLLNCHFNKKSHWKIYLFAICIGLFPPLRLAAKRCVDEQHIWFLYHWQPLKLSLQDYTQLQQKIEKKFLYSVLAISIFMIPFWLTELFMSIEMTRYPVLYHIVNLGNALIWGIFVAEFIVMMAIVKKRWQYLAKHWLELLIIILPMFALVRFVRIASYTRIITLTRFQQLIVSQLVKFQRLLNLYRTRTVFNRLFRMLILINVFRNWHLRHHPQKHLANLLEELKEKELEILQLKEQIAKAREQLEQLEHFKQIK